MSDKDRIVEMLTRARIPFQLTQNAQATTSEGVTVGGDWRIRIEEGYIGFFTVMVFDVDGVLQKVEAYEE